MPDDWIIWAGNRLSLRKLPKAFRRGAVTQPAELTRPRCEGCVHEWIRIPSCSGTLHYWIISTFVTFRPNSEHLNQKELMDVTTAPPVSLVLETALSTSTSDYVTSEFSHDSFAHMAHVWKWIRERSERDRPDISTNRDRLSVLNSGGMDILAGWMQLNSKCQST